METVQGGPKADRRFCAEAARAEGGGEWRGGEGVPRFVPVNVDIDEITGKHTKIPAISRWTSITPEESKAINCQPKYSNWKHFMFVTGKNSEVFVLDYDRKNIDCSHHIDKIDGIEFHEDWFGSFDTTDTLTTRTISGGYHKVYKYTEELWGKIRSVQALDVLRPACPPVVIKALHSDYWEIGLQEARLLRYLNACDPLDASHVVRLLSTFSFRGHACLVLEQLHDSLLEVICRRTGSREFVINPVHNIRKVAVQLLGALALLQSAGLVHGDIKPENVLLKKCWRERTGHNRSCSCSLPLIEGTMLRPCLDGHHANSDVLHREVKLVGNQGVGLKLADFGNSFGVESAQRYYGHVDIQSLSYRAPEVCFGLPFDQSIDMWSVGCIIAELALGRLLFACSSNAQLLQQMNAALGGPPPAEPFRKGVFYNKLIHEAGLAGGEKPSLLRQDWRRESAYVNFSRPGYSALGDALLAVDKDLAKLVCGLLQYDPRCRLSPLQALLQPFFRTLLPYLAAPSTTASSLQPFSVPLSTRHPLDIPQMYSQHQRYYLDTPCSEDVKHPCLPSGLKNITGDHKTPNISGGVQQSDNSKVLPWLVNVWLCEHLRTRQNSYVDWVSQTSPCLGLLPSRPPLAPERYIESRREVAEVHGLLSEEDFGGQGTEVGRQWNQCILRTTLFAARYMQWKVAVVARHLLKKLGGAREGSALVA
eukprot:SM000063S19978  [mRNA]  locus=s63:11382:17403:+ [translate_table: standard]